MATVTLPVKLVAVSPAASWTVTTTAGVIAAPAVVVLGCVVKARRVGIGVRVAVNVTGVALFALTVIVLVPTVPASVTVVWARPCALVTAVGGETEPPPL